jgi:hypothetical protein
VAPYSKLTELQQFDSRAPLNWAHVLSESFFLTLKKKIFGCGVIFRLTRPAFPEIRAPQLAKLTELQQLDS